MKKKHDFCLDLPYNSSATTFRIVKEPADYVHPLIQKAFVITILRVLEPALFSRSGVYAPKTIMTMNSSTLPVIRAALAGSNKMLLNSLDPTHETIEKILIEADNDKSNSYIILSITIKLKDGTNLERQVMYG